MNTLRILLFLTLASVARAAPVLLFDGKSFTGWEGDTTNVWRIENGGIVAGKPDAEQAKNDFLCTVRDYADFELRLQYRRGDNNGGIQFRSERVPNHHEVSGYQADFAPGIDGCLYDESRRNRFLGVFGISNVDLASGAGRPGALIQRAQDSRAENERKLKLGEWNRYRIRAEGTRVRLWINDVPTVDYTEQDAAIPRTGKIALQIHGGATEIRYRDITIEVLDAKPAPAPAEGKKKQSFRIGPDAVIALTGGSNIERTRFNGGLQAQMIASQPEGKIKVRNFGWEGDTVFEQWRDGGTEHWRQQRDWKRQLAEIGATVVLAQFGQMESLGGVEKLPAFIAAYEKLLADFAAGGRRVVLVSPMPFEKSRFLLAPDLTQRNRDVRAYVDAIRDLAARVNAEFVDLYSLCVIHGARAGRLTDNGYQLNETGHRAVADWIAGSLGITPRALAETAAVRREVVEMERLWFDYWRPMNWAFLSGDRTSVAYSKDWRDDSKRIFPEEMNDFLPLLKQAEENIWNALAGRPVTPVGIRSSIPVEPPSAAPQSPAEELASFKVLDGFQVNLFASEADGIVKPIQMRWDERGRLWVACAVSYPQIKPGEKANDYVLVCEDTDGDGRADKFTKFAEGLFMPTGIELGDGGLYVAQGTELLHLRDTDGDGRADTRRIVLGGFGTADSHQMINSINWGFGGELWFTQGHHIYSRVETPFGVETLNRAGVWRLRPRTGHLDPFFQWSSAGANCWGVVTTDYGQPFHKSGATIGVFYSTPGLVRSSLAVNSMAMNLCLAPVKQVGMEFIGSSHFPAEMQGRAVIGGYYRNVLEQHELTIEDGMYRSKLLPNIIETKSTVFRPVEVRGGPDGALYVAEWYNPIIGHYQASYRHPDRDKAHGRIWRVTYKDRPLVQPAPLAKMSVAELFEQLDSPERWVKYQAKRLLFAGDSRNVTAALDRWLAGLKAGDARDEYRRLQALAVYEAHETPRPALLKSLLRSPDARVRAYATRTLSTWARDDSLPDALTLLEAQIADEDAIVRLEAIVAASYLPDARAAVIAARALDRDFNACHLHALTKTLHVTNPLWAPLVSAGKLQFDKDEHLIFALQNGWVENDPGQLANHWGALVAYQPQVGGKATAIMRQQAARHAGDAARQTVWLKALAAAASVEDLPFIFERGGRNAEVLAALKTARPQDAEARLAPLLDDANEAVRVQALRLAGAWKVTAFTGRIRGIVFDEKAALPLRKAAIGATAAPADLLRVLDDSQAAVLHAAALESLLGASPGAAAQFILRRLGDAKTAPEAAVLLQALLNRKEGIPALQNALQAPAALSAASAKITLQALNSIGRSDAKLAPPLMKLAGISAALPVYTKDYVADLVSAAGTTGDAAEGRKVFEQTGCIACHMPGAPGSKIGPDLSTISRGMPTDMIIAEVIWPALNVKEGYEAATVTMKDGSVVAGFKQTETGGAIAIRDMATGEVRSITKTDTAKIQTGGTVMPDGLTAALSEKQLADLIRYLSELGK